MIARREATADYMKKLEREIEAAETKCGEAKKNLEEARRTVESEHHHVGGLLESAKAAEAALQTQRGLIDEANRALTNAERNLAEKESRLDILKQLNEEGEGLTQGSQALLKGADEQMMLNLSRLALINGLKESASLLELAWLCRWRSSVSPGFGLLQGSRRACLAGTSTRSEPGKFRADLRGPCRPRFQCTPQLRESCLRRVPKAGPYS